ncbi:ABC transporter permease subunit [Paenibacillus sp. LHD-117]|uniref:ABC transporter permease n=1 Tax=Paenibacillus sp. LHD-117 TaxID=3071412 RepID=UPI0027E07437|nr:ABC transporter permease subunit [Paenibacillus sp. LHD-117]MDQ6419987.1 ABC transporter permease subunit [Paenibacillus sp. LHD-117]
MGDVTAVVDPPGKARRLGTDNRKEKRRAYKKYRVLLLLMIPSVVYVTIFNYIPIYGLLIAFENFHITKGFFNSPWVGLEHFRNAFQDPYFFVVLKNTILISLYKMLWGFPIPILFAVLLSEVRNAKFKKTVQTVSYLPHFISWIILGGIFMSIFSLDGPVNAVIRLFGGDPILFMADQQYFRAVLVATSVLASFGWSSIIYFAAIAGIDPHLHEAAVVDGAGRLKRMLYITIPLLMPVISIMLVLSMSGILDAGFDQIFNMYNTNVYDVSDIIDTYVYRKGLVDMDYGYATAVGLFKSLVGLVLMLTVNGLAKKMGGGEHTLW